MAQNEVVRFAELTKWLPQNEAVRFAQPLQLGQKWIYHRQTNIQLQTCIIMQPAYLYSAMEFTETLININGFY